MNISELIAAAAKAAEKPAVDDELAAVLEHGNEARLHVWDRHYATAAGRRRLDEKLAASSPSFQAAVAATERILADELAADDARRAQIRVDNPTYFQDYP